LLRYGTGCSSSVGTLQLGGGDHQVDWVSSHWISKDAGAESLSSSSSMELPLLASSCPPVIYNNPLHSTEIHARSIPKSGPVYCTEKASQLPVTSSPRKLSVVVEEPVVTEASSALVHHEVFEPLPKDKGALAESTPIVQLDPCIQCSSFVAVDMPPSTVFVPSGSNQTTAVKSQSEKFSSAVKVPLVINSGPGLSSLSDIASSNMPVSYSVPMCNSAVTMSNLMHRPSVLYDLNQNWLPHARLPVVPFSIAQSLLVQNRPPPAVIPFVRPFAMELSMHPPGFPALRMPAVPATLMQMAQPVLTVDTAVGTTQADYIPVISVANHADQMKVSVSNPVDNMKASMSDLVVPMKACITEHLCAKSVRIHSGSDGDRISSPLSEAAVSREAACATKQTTSDEKFVSVSTDSPLSALAKVFVPKVFLNNQVCCETS
jgi:hypothetical protein